MDYGLVFYILGQVLKVESALMLFPLAVSIIYKEGTSTYLIWLFVSIISLVLGIILSIKKPKGRPLNLRDGNICVGLTWIVMSVIGTLPFVLTKDIPNFIDAFFETVSGFTTTGASILPKVEVLRRSTMFWHSFTHWIGGMGIFVFIMSFLPLLGSSTIHLMRAESPGYSVDRMLPRLKDTAKDLYKIYLFITALMISVLFFCKMPFFDNICLTFGSLGTGGFAVKNDSIASYTSLQQNIIMIFMIFSGVNYSVYFAMKRRDFKSAVKNEEVRWYFLIIIMAAILIFLELSGFNQNRTVYFRISDALKHSFFQVGSIITTTGYSSTDFDLWPSLSKAVLLMLMMLGACAGSTGGGFKVSRFLILAKEIKSEMRAMFHPNSVRKIRLSGTVISSEAVRSVNVFTAIYIMIFTSSIVLISVDNFNITTNISAVAATFNNIGPGFSIVGATGSYAGFSAFSKLVLTFDMLCGRLELLPMLTLFAPVAWKRR